MVMTIKELIEVLEKVENKDLEVVVQVTDPTNWEYNNPVEFTEVQSVLLVEDDDDKTEVFVINGGDV
jgi:hypothetical protein